MDTVELVIGGESRAAEQVAILERLKVALAASAPGLDAGLIEGDSLAAIEESFEALRSALPPVPPQVPAGSPGRSQIVPRTPFEKIREGLAAADRDTRTWRSGAPRRRGDYPPRRIRREWLSFSLQGPALKH